MFKYFVVFLALINSFSLHANSLVPNTPPIAKKIPTYFEMHGDHRCDHYYWLKNSDDPEVIKYLEDWNTYTANAMAFSQEFQEQLYQEMYSRLEEDFCSSNVVCGEYDYYVRQKNFQDNSVLYRKKRSPDGTEELLIDQNEMAANVEYYKIRKWAPSCDGKTVALAVDLEGSCYTTIFLLDCEKKVISANEIIPNTSPHIIWKDDSSGFWYIKVDDVYRESKVMFHAIHTDFKDDRLIYEEPDTLFDLKLTRSQDKRFIFINSLSRDTSEAFYFRADDASCQLHKIAEKSSKRQYYPESHQDRFFLRVKNGTSNSSIYTTAIDSSSAESWKLLFAGSDSVQYIDMHVFKNYLVLSKIENGLIIIESFNLQTGEIVKIPFPHLQYYAEVKSNQDYSGTKVKIKYKSPLYPDAILSYDMELRVVTLVKQRKVKGFDTSKYKLEKINAVAEDGTMIPITLIYQKDALNAGPAPIVMYGYGAYESLIDCSFYSPLFSLIDRGVIYAMAHIRGGGDFGRVWYEQGRLLKKKNTFTDFISCALHLINNGYTTNSKLVIEGMSAGGLLMGTVMNMRPDLFKAVVADVPFIDVLTDMSDLTIPYVTQEFEEWGDCRNRDEYFYMKDYSPYDNIERKNYPSILITSALNDVQVPFWEGAKFAAKLLEHKTDNNVLLFNTNLTAGHYGHSKRSYRLRDMSFKYAFMLQQLGIDK
jgi:oligopeptidase B